MKQFHSFYSDVLSGRVCDVGAPCGVNSSEDAELPTVQPRGFARQHPTPSGTEPVFPKVHLARRAPHSEGPGPSPPPQAHLREEHGTQTERSVFSWSLLTLSSWLDVSAGCQIASQEPRGTGRRAPVQADRRRQDLSSLSLD